MDKVSDEVILLDIKSETDVFKLNVCTQVLAVVLGVAWQVAASSAKSCWPTQMPCVLPQHPLWLKMLTCEYCYTQKLQSSQTVLWQEMSKC